MDCWTPLLASFFFLTLAMYRLPCTMLPHHRSHLPLFLTSPGEESACRSPGRSRAWGPFAGRTTCQLVLSVGEEVARSHQLQTDLRRLLTQHGAAVHGFLPPDGWMVLLSGGEEGAGSAGKRAARVDALFSQLLQRFPAVKLVGVVCVGVWGGGSGSKSGSGCTCPRFGCACSANVGPLVSSQSASRRTNFRAISTSLVTQALYSSEHKIAPEWQHFLELAGREGGGDSGVSSAAAADLGGQETAAVLTQYQRQTRHYIGDIARLDSSGAKVVNVDLNPSSSRADGVNATASVSTSPRYLLSVSFCHLKDDDLRVVRGPGSAGALPGQVYSPVDAAMEEWQEQLAGTGRRRCAGGTSVMREHTSLLVATCGEVGYMLGVSGFIYSYVRTPAPTARRSPHFFHAPLFMFPFFPPASLARSIAILRELRSITLGKAC